MDDLLVEWYEDIFSKNPIEIHRNEAGDIQFQDTGDDLVDAWEKNIAKGGNVNLWEAFSDSSKQDLLKKFAKIKELKGKGLLQEAYDNAPKDMTRKR